MRYLKITFFIFSQIALVFVHIYKQNLFIRTSFTLQKLEKTKSQLLHYLTELENEFSNMHNKKTIQEYAEKRLNMKPLGLKNITKATLEQLP